MFKANGSKTPLTYVKFQAVVAKLGTPDIALNAPSQLPLQCQTSFSTSDFDVPTLEGLKVDLTGLGDEIYPGGETEALSRFEKYMNKQVR